MPSKKRTIEDGLYTLAFFLALGVRLFNLGRAPLSNLEADAALQAWDLTRGLLPVSAAHPLYISLTRVSFSLLGSTNFMARLWPALAGSVLVLVPLALRSKLGRLAALALAFGLALDPGLVALSRLVNSSMLAVSCTALALTLAYARKPAWSGIFAGLALLSGPGVWIGWLGLGIAWGAARLAGFTLETESAPRSKTTSPESEPGLPSFQTGIIYAVASILLIGTRFFTYPAGLGALATSLGAFFAGWLSPSGTPALRLLAMTGVYTIGALIFTGVALSWPRARHRWVTGLGIWALSALVLTLLYPGRTAADLVWVLVPLWGMAAAALAAVFADDLRQPMVAGQAAAWFVLLSLSWITLASLHRTLPEGYALRWLILLGIGVLGVLSTAFVGLGWSWAIARSGTLLGMLAALVVYSTAAMVGASQTRPNSPAELWSSPPLTGQADLLLATLHDLALTEQGLPDHLELVSLVDQSAMRWVLKDFSEVRYTSALADAELPPVVIAPQESESATWAAAYRGQDFAWALSPAWAGALPEAWVDWLVFRNAPIETEYLILWARGDLFPGQELMDANAEELPVEKNQQEH